ncbi:MAG: hypothetical protein ACLQDM_23970 [Bradyrhizobium sp.]
MNFHVITVPTSRYFLYITETAKSLGLTLSDEDKRDYAGANVPQISP